MKRYLIAVAVFCALPAHADETALEALCAASGGQLKLTELSNVRRLDCAGSQVTWFRIHATAGESRTMVNYEATRPGSWRAAMEAAVSDLGKLCGDMTPSIQLSGNKVTASCRSAR
ncbi:MAG: hypothetical protein C0522_05495 [Rhodocyclaceae bacterium]|jgi:hypothetical protein|nr:hypothetical protein [Rhodocyclaceae bacterium]